MVMVRTDPVVAQATGNTPAADETPGKQPLEQEETGGPSNLEKAPVDALDDEPYMGYWSCGLFSPTNRVRLAARRLVRLRFFDKSVDLCIVLNCLSLAFRENGLESQCAYASDPVSDTLLLTLDLLFTSIFTSELLLKLLVYGAISHRGSYFRDGWNWIDAVVVILSILGLMPGLCVYLSGLSALRAVRLLRAMRSIKQFRAMAATVQALIDAGPKLAHVGVLLVFIFCCFGILGVQVCVCAIFCTWRDAQPPGAHLDTHMQRTRAHPALSRSRRIRGSLALS